MISFLVGDCGFGPSRLRANGSGGDGHVQFRPFPTPHSRGVCTTAIRPACDQARSKEKSFASFICVTSVVSWCVDWFALGGLFHALPPIVDRYSLAGAVPGRV